MPAADAARGVIGVLDRCADAALRSAHLANAPTVRKCRTRPHAFRGLLLVTAAALSACGPKEQAGTQPPPSTVAAVTTSTTTTTTTMPTPPPAWRAARWGMKKPELLAAFPSEAQKLATPADFGQPRPGPSDIAIPAYDADGSTFRVLFGFGAEGLSRIQLTALKPSAAACEDLEKRLTEENAKPSSRGETGTSLPGQEIVWTTPLARIALSCAEKPSLGFRTVTLDYTPPGP